LFREHAETESEQHIASVQLYVEASEDVIVARPGEKRSVSLYVGSGSRGRIVALGVEGLEPVARYTLTPQQGVTPFSSKLELLVSRNVVGIHPFDVVAKDMLSSNSNAINLILVVIPEEYAKHYRLVQKILNNIHLLLTYYKNYGLQYIIWFTLARIHREEGISFTEIRTIYELFVGRRLRSNGTVGI